MRTPAESRPRKLPSGEGKLADEEESKMGNEGKRYRGKMKFWDRDRGYGFVCADDGRDYFLHVSEVHRAQINENDIFDGVKVSFMLVAGNSKGPKCSELELAPI